MLDSKTQVEEFLNIQSKNLNELRAICEGMKLKTHGEKEDLIDRLLALDVTEQRSVIVAQAIPLRTRGNDSQPLVAAVEAMRNWRRAIFQTKGNKKEFQLLNSKGKQYSANLKYLRCSTATLQRIIAEGWFLPLDFNRDLINLLKTEPNRFVANIVQKPDGQGNSWLMLHVAAKAA